MEPGTILSIIQLSGSVLKLGHEIALEFFGPDNAPVKLKHLNNRLQILNEFLEREVKHPGSPDKLSATSFPGSASLEKTLVESKAFLEQYRSLLGEKKSIGSAAKRVLLAVGPDASRIGDLHGKIDQHYTELGQWRMGRLVDEVQEIRKSIILFQEDVSILRHPEPLSVPEFIPKSPKALEIDEEVQGLYIFRESPTFSPATHASPAPRMRSRTNSSNSISELPPPAIPIPPESINGHTPQFLGTFASPGPRRDSRHTSLGSISELPSTHGLTFPFPFIASPNTPGSRPLVTLKLGQGIEPQFSADAYRIYEGQAGRVVEWFSHEFQIRHFIPSDERRIPYTKPNDSHADVTFLPLGSKHRLEITTAAGRPELTSYMVRYRFARKCDREEFQRQLRVRRYLAMIQATRIHTKARREIAINVHVKIWGGRSRHLHDGSGEPNRDRDIEPTLSFPAMSNSKDSERIQQNVEYVIRWFQKSVELNGENRLIMRPYIEDADLHYGPLGETTTSIFIPRRRLSTSSDGLSSSRSRSRTSSVGGGSVFPVLYESKGIVPPGYVRNLKKLEIEFPNSSYRQRFINCCYEAHRPGLATSPPASPVMVMDTPTVISTSAPSPLFSSPPGSRRTTMSEIQLPCPSRSGSVS